MAAIPRKAATVILLRERRPAGFEVLLLKRHEQSNFFGGNYVYPGGKVDRDDGSLEICSRSRGITPDMAQQILGGSTSREESFAYWIAAVRELFEEAGILMAYDEHGALFEPKGAEGQERLLQNRLLVHQGKITLCQLAHQEQLTLALDQLHYLAHWITPEARPQRFDTRFFVARLPGGQEAVHDRKETTVGAWITPRQALEENLHGELVLSPPTLKTIEDLACFRTVDEIINSLPTLPPQPILPFLTEVHGETLIIFPWDPEFESFRSGKATRAIGEARPSSPGDNTTRLVLRNGHWHPYCR